MTVTDLPLGADRLIRKPLTALPSVRDASLIENDGTGSLSVIVPVQAPSAMVAFVGLERLTAKASSSSSRMSCAELTFTVLVVVPGAKVSVPDFEA